MKKTLALCLLLSMILALGACGSSPVSEPSGAQGSSSDPQSAAPAEEAPAEPATLEYYYWDDAFALSEQRIERGIKIRNLSPDDPAIGTRLESITTYTYDAFGEPTEKVACFTDDEILSINTLNDYHLLYNDDGSENTDDFLFEHGADGQITKIQRINSGNSKLLDYSAFENGKIVKSWQTLNPASTERDDTVLMNEFGYDETGRLLSEESFQYLADGLFGIVTLEKPSHDLREFDAASCLIHWVHENPVVSADDPPAQTIDVRYEYDANCELTGMTVVRNGGTPETLEIVRDAEGRALSSVLTGSDGSVTTRSYGYDDLGRLVSEDVSGGNGEVSFRLEYNDDGYPASMTKYVNGKASKPTKYVYEKRDNDIMVSADFTFDEADIFESFGDEIIVEPRYDEYGNLERDYQYEVAVVGTKIMFRRVVISNEYEPIFVREKTEPGAFDPVSSIADFYPELYESYGGYAVPKPDGTERLASVRMESNRIDALDIVSSIVYDSGGNVAGLISRFDNGILSSNVDYEFDEQGRVIRLQLLEHDFDYTFSYADDGRSYTSVESSSTGSGRETTFSLDECRITDMLRPSADAADTIDEYSEEGLLLRAPMSSRPDEVYFSYDYSFERAPDGSLHKIKADRYYIEDRWSTVTVLEFDDHGYPLTFTKLPSYGDSVLSFEYGYTAA